MLTSVSALCPSFVETPIFDAAKAIHIDKSAITKKMKKHKMMSPQKLAKIAINGVHKNKLIICPMPLRKTMDVIFTIFPSMHHALGRFICKVVRETKESSDSY